jgi:hypothetical protein
LSRVALTPDFESRDRRRKPRWGIAENNVVSLKYDGCHPSAGGYYSLIVDATRCQLAKPVKEGSQEPRPQSQSWADRHQLDHNQTTSQAAAVTMSSPTDCEVLIVGAGPVGLLVTLSLAKAGIHATLIESLPDIDESPRAMAYGAAAVVELERAGIAADARAVGMEPSDYDHRLRWITIDNELIAEFKPEDRLEGSLDPVICGQHALAKVMERHLGECPSGKVSLMLS